MISVYPNPTAGKVNISGVNAGNRIKVVNLLGATLVDKVAASSLEVISLEGQPSGLYFITVNNADHVIGNFKLIKQ
jgi:hypothetical protein